MDDQAELRGFLTTRRARISPEEAGMTPFPGMRRVAGMRREEVAYLAGISVDYYTRLERGRVAGISEEILEAVGRALQLNDIEQEHLVSLVQALRPATTRRARPQRTAFANHDQLLQGVVDAMSLPAYIQNNRLDIVAANRIGWKVFPHAERHRRAETGRPFNHMRFQILDPRAHDFYADWEGSIRGGVSLLRDAAARDRADDELFTLIGELSSKSEMFRTLWASHDVLRYQRVKKRFRHPLVGDLTFNSQSFSVDGDAGRTLVVYSVEPGSSTEDSLRILDTWTSEGDASLAVAADHTE